MRPYDNQLIYVQIFDYVCTQIMNHQWYEEERIPSVRELAVQWEINPNTVVRAYTLLADAGIIVNQRGIGFFVATGAVESVLSRQRHQFVSSELPQFANKMRTLGFSFTDLPKLEKENTADSSRRQPPRKNRPRS